MITHNCFFDQSQSKILKAFKELQIGKFLRKSNITKSQGFSSLEIFKFIVLLIFHQKNLYRFLQSKYNESAFSKNTYYRFLNDSSSNWRKFLLYLSAFVVSHFSNLTCSKRVKTLVLDDSIYTRNRSKSVELLARVYDHVSKKYQRGFSLLTLGWTDGQSFVPMAFNLLSSAKQHNCLCPMSSDTDRRSNGYRFRTDSLLPKTDAAIRLVQSALDFGIQAQYVLMDSWFTTEPFLQRLLDLGMHSIGMVKQLKQRYFFQGKFYTLHQLKRFVSFHGNKNIFGSLLVTTKNGLLVKIVFVRNRNKRSECLYLLSTDCSVDDQEVVRIYGNRWSIECFFKCAKSFLGLGKEFQSRNYGALVSHTTIVFTRYILLEWVRRHQCDMKTYGELFFMFCDDIQDMTLFEALRSLMALFVKHISASESEIQFVLKSKVCDWIASQAPYIKLLFANLSWES